MEENEKFDVKKKTKEETEKIIKDILDEGIQSSNIEFLYKVVDIHKDISNEEYWEKEAKMRYRGYGNYGNDSYGRRYETGNYGRRGVDAKYRGDDMMNDMYQGYREYSENRENYGRGNYGAKEDTMKSLQYMLQSVEDFMEMLKQEAQSQEEVEMIKHTAKNISEM